MINATSLYAIIFLFLILLSSISNSIKNLTHEINLLRIELKEQNRRTNWSIDSVSRAIRKSNDR